MTTSYYADRANLYRLQQLHPDWSQPQLAAAVGRSPGWVKKWLKRFREMQASGEPLGQVLQGHSRARQHPPTSIPAVVVERILAIRDAPPEGLHRVPGAKAIQYYLARDEQIQALPVPIVPSKRTIDRILHQQGRIAQRIPRQPQPMERPAAMTQWQLDFKDVSSVPAEPEGKREHGVETLNVVDMGTSLVLDAQVREDFTAETALQAFAQTLQQQGVPARVTGDRDPRWVGSPQGSDFPSALLRFAACLGIQVQVCDPHHPQQNGFVERFNRTYQEECLAWEHPKSLEEARRVTETFQQHYNFQRPHQALSCENQPPRIAFPLLPPLPSLPEVVDPDAWLNELDGLHLERKVDRHGSVSLDLKRYYVSAKLVGQRVTLCLDAATRSVQVFHEQTLLKSLPIKGLVGKPMPFAQFLEYIAQQARAQHRLRSLQERRFRSATVPRPPATMF